MRLIKTIAFCAIALAATTALYAQHPVPYLQDLIGASGRDGEAQMQHRGYTHVRTEKSDDSAYSFWTDNRSGHCVQVRTTDGRYASIVHTPDTDCGDGDQATIEQEDTFETLCGSAVDGKITRYRCKASDRLLSNGKKITTLKFPDMEMELLWHNERNVRVEREGMNTVQAKYNTANGSHEIYVDGMTYFYVFDLEEAERRLLKFNK